MQPPPSQEPRSFPSVSFPVVGIGGSAGSLEPLQTFLTSLPAAPGMAFIIVTHHPPGKRTLLPRILEEHTVLPISEAAEEMPIERDHIYVALSNGEWVLSKGQLVRQAQGREKAEGIPRRVDYRGLRHPVDTFFRSLAAEQGDQAIGIVLSGTGTDGTVGTKAIKSQAGMVMVQEPASAEFSGMPSSAIATNLVDYIVAPADMPPTLVSYVEAKVRRKALPTEPSSGIPETTLEAILSLVNERTGHDFSGYKRSTLLRRLERRMNIHNIEEPADYLAYLGRNVAERDLLFREVIISVTNFFRDPEAWEALAEGPLKEQIKEAASADQAFRAWVVGCATGEEAYTLAILISECLEQLEQTVLVQIFATDVDAEAVETARVGRYPAGIAEDLTPERLARHFVAERDTYRISKPIRDMVVFAEHNVLQDPPFTRMNLITCRNLLIYLQREMQKQLLPLFQYALRPKGLLFLGASETVDDLSQAFSQVDKRWRLYRVARNEAQAPGFPGVPLGGGHYGLTLERQPWEDPRGGNGLSRSVERLLASEFAPPSVLVNDRGEAVYFHGHLGQFLEPAPGPAHNRLVEMTKNGLRATLVKALREASGQEPEPVQRHAWVWTNGGYTGVLLEVRPLRVPRALRGLRMVSFWPSPAPEREVDKTGQGESRQQPEGRGGGRITELEQELEAAHQDKQVTVEELQSSNEELQSMNEELQSMNEELQSSNEELEVSKEEVESLNEELHTVNAELESRLKELSQANDIMKNLLDSTEVAVLFLDEDMRITRFTEAARQLIALRESDLGRPINELRTNLRYQRLTQDAQEVLDTLSPKEVEVQTESGHWFLLRVLPYRTTENVISGLVCVFRDMEAAKRLEASQSFFWGIVQTVREPLLVLNPELQVISANDGFYQRFPLTPEEVEGKKLFEVGGGQWDHPELRTRLREVLPAKQSIEDLELTLDFGEREPSHVWLNARQLQRVSGEPEAILLTMEIAGGAATGGEGTS